MISSPFVHLRTHSQYSILDASASISDLSQRAFQEGMSSIALTDHGNLFGIVDFYKACKEAKVKSIIGCELYVAPGSRLEKTKVYGQRAAYHLTLLAQNNRGYQNLAKLSSSGYIEGFYYYPRVDHDLLRKHSEGLICLSGSLGTLLAHEILQENVKSIQDHLLWYQEVFKDRFYLDLQRHEMAAEDIQQDGLYQESWLVQQYQDYFNRQQKVNEALIALSREHHIPLVATNDVHYIDREDWRAHEILLNIQSGEPCEIWEKDAYGTPKFRIPNPKRQTYPSHEYYFKSSQQMEQLFKDIPEAIINTQKIAEQCLVEIDFKTKHYPVYLPPSLENRPFEKDEQKKEVENYLWKLCEEGISNRYTIERLAKVQEIYPDRNPLDVVRERLNYEMSIIVPKGMSDYLLIVWDFINWAKRNGIPMGPGRGSGAGSIVLYLIGITDIEPLRFHLFFERFINPERISYPDIDVDICMDRRGEVIAYTLQKYGKDNVAQIITFGTMKAKMALKDVGRVLSVPLSKVNEIAKLVPEDLNITLDKALEKDQDLRQLYENDEEVGRLIDLAKKLEGSIRNTGIHAAGIIISGVPLTNLIPICNSKDSDIPVTQFSMKPVEAVGMLKVDFLGLKTLTAIQICVNAVKASTGKEIDWINLPLDDKPTFDLLNQGKTLGIFQLESGGMQDLARQLHLDRFEEIIAVGALYRPGPMDMIPSFINRKHGREAIENDHPWMKDILAETYGIMVYQEQVMQIASKLANFSLGEGDVLRRAMGKKDMDQMTKQREKFRLGALENQIDNQTSMLIFDKMEKFAAYGFNKSHAAAYGYLSYVTAYLKANYPGEWMASLMTCDRDDLSKVAKFIRECQSMNIPMLPPDINEAGEIFQATKQGIRFAMTGIKGVGAGVVEAIVQERQKRGPFKNFYEFFKRIDTKKVGKKVVESLVEAGSFDFTGWARDALVMSIDPMYESSSKEQKEQAMGFMSLFAKMDDEMTNQFRKPPEVKNKTSRQDLLRKEKALLGFFLTGHPMDEYKDILQRLSCVPLRRLDQLNHDAVFRSAFIVESLQIRIASKSQKKFSILTISDGMERQELPIWPDLFEEKSHLLQENQLLYAVLQIEKKDGEVKLSCRWLDDLTKANEEMIETCDRAYDKAKHQAVRFAQNKNIATKQSEKSKTEKIIVKQNQEASSMKTVCIKLNADQARLSHILKIKKLIQDHHGTTSVLIDFHNSTKSLATLHIDAKWGITLSEQFKQKICELPCVLEIE
ncbi:DNA polymerase III subunit alpha [Candidatus Protochlamydia amoebophila]|uniref:DNA polymerase III subunit alpha n=1 Tax=Candidatus Protochlamydia amoebophila TaxID=362787 RepID=UPI001BC94243|nr:DNA polymerase III subunit alpha [Candidatus Protochlamydia amoebophila]MBS4164304.1 DNA polymerase III subunit alpha [Candidatus Protochlamydia amoebophila]